jgi:APA family basic amino acid/polyamine antiporter
MVQVLMKNDRVKNSLMNNSQQLNRSLGLGLVVVVVVGNIIGSGVYKKVAPMAAELHSSGWVLICWVLGGIISLFGALSNAEIASMMADTGGEYVLLSENIQPLFRFYFWLVAFYRYTNGIHFGPGLCFFSIAE